MDEFKIETSKTKQIVDITENLSQIIKNNNIKNGVCYAFITHTTCALTTADLDPGTDKDMLKAFEAIMPKLKYHHPHDPSHVGDHIMASIIGSSVIVPVENGKLVLGTWQRVVLVELNGPRERNITIRLVQ